MNTIVFYTDEMLRILHQPWLHRRIGVTIATVFWRPLMASRTVMSSVVCMGCIIGCATASCCELAAAAASWFPQLLTFCEKFHKKCLTIFVQSAN